ncbi:YIP1 family protein [Candidatus Daviesbacteria bacterium]|nr:YIP1 family protein [Candidatus Daviesbacteria bacterium]
MTKVKLKKSVKLNFELNLKNYIQLLRYSLLSPRNYVEQIPIKASLQSSLIFFALNVCVAYIMGGLVQEAFNFGSTSFFFGISQLTMLVPFLILLLITFSAIFFVISKLLSGKGSFEQTLSVLAYSSLTLIFTQVPALGLIGFLLTVYFVGFGLKKINEYSLGKTIVTVSVPLMILVLAITLLGLLGTLFFSSVNSTLNPPPVINQSNQIDSINIKTN